MTTKLRFKFIRTGTPIKQYVCNEKSEPIAYMISVIGKYNIMVNFFGHKVNFGQKLSSIKEAFELCNLMSEKSN